jgi:hypothetical protein
MPDPAAPSARHWRRFLPSFSRRDIIEGAIVAIAFLLYFWVRGAVIDRPEIAYRNALDIIEAQRSLGIYWEPEMNAWVAERYSIAQAMNLTYFYLHFPLIIVFGIWLHYYRRHRYTFLRDAFLMSGAIALVIYWLYPVAPPREMPALAAAYDPNAPPYVLGFVDTMKEYLGYAYDTQSTRAFVNPYAAMPSLHFGWDLLLGIGIIWAFWKERWRWFVAPFAVALPVSQLFAITTTANHYFLDAVAGGLVALAGLGIAYGIQRLVYPSLTAYVHRLPWPSVKRWLVPEEDRSKRAGAPG